MLYFIPKALRSKMSLRWRVGTFLGNAMSTDEAYVAAASDGDVLRTRSIVGVVEPSRCSSKAIFRITSTPFKLRPSSHIEYDMWRTL